MRHIWTVVFVVALTWIILSPAAHATSTYSRSRVSLDMIILIPHGRELAVFQQVVFSQAMGGVTPVGIFSHAQTPRVIGGQLVRRQSGIVWVLPRTTRLALRYRIPWNKQSLATEIDSPMKVGTLVVLAEPTITLPEILNPVWAPVGEGRIPGVANSPTFDEYASRALRVGQRVPLVVESGPMSLGVKSTGNHPGVARAFKLAMALFMLAAVVGAMHWRKASQHSAFSIALQRLARLAAALRQGTIDVESYYTQRQRILRQLRMVDKSMHEQ